MDDVTGLEGGEKGPGVQQHTETCFAEAVDQGRSFWQERRGKKHRGNNRSPHGMASPSHRTRRYATCVSKRIIHGIARYSVQEFAVDPDGRRGRRES